VSSQAVLDIARRRIFVHPKWAANIRRTLTQPIPDAKNIYTPSQYYGVLRAIEEPLEVQGLDSNYKEAWTWKNLRKTHPDFCHHLGGKLSLVPPPRNSEVRHYANFDTARISPAFFDWIERQGGAVDPSCRETFKSTNKDYTATAPSMEILTDIAFHLHALTGVELSTWFTLLCTYDFPGSTQVTPWEDFLDQDEPTPMPNQTWKKKSAAIVRVRTYAPLDSIRNKEMRNAVKTYRAGAVQADLYAS